MASWMPATSPNRKNPIWPTCGLKLSPGAVLAKIRRKLTMSSPNYLRQTHAPDCACSVCWS
ncbi:TPA: DUF5447 family protein, partial [Pseudomonas aeruginosa]